MNVTSRETRFDISSVVSRMKTDPDYTMAFKGLLLKADCEDASVWKKFVSSNGSIVPQRPYVEITRQTGESLQSVAALAKANNETIASISKLSDQQKTAIDEISTGIGQLTSVVQANAAASGQSAASAQEMSSQSSILSDIVSHFRLKDAALPSPPSAHLPAAQQSEIIEYIKDLGKY